MTETNVQQDVRKFYDDVGWQQVSDGVYQNAQYEDLRPVSREYIHKCHLRVNRYFRHSGKYFLDAGSGPIQYPEYLTYSEGYQYRVCLDISIVALMEARERIKDHGLFVVADIARLPLDGSCFDDLVSLHTIHHLPPEDYKPAYLELRRVLKNGATAVVVNGWSDSALMRLYKLPMRVMEKVFGRSEARNEGTDSRETKLDIRIKAPAGTFVHKLTSSKLQQMLGEEFPIKIGVWRSVSVRFLRAMIQPILLGKFWLKILYIKEELFPRFFGEKGQYPLITFKK